MKKRLSVLLSVILLAMMVPQAALASSYASTIYEIHSSFVSSNRSASGAPQQQVNGAYRSVELLEVWAYEIGVSSSVMTY